MTQEAATPQRIKNTFGPPNCITEYFTPGSLFGLLKAGFSYHDLPPEAQKMVDPVIDAYEKRVKPATGRNYLQEAKAKAAKLGMYDLKNDKCINPEAWHKRGIELHDRSS